MHTLDSLLTKRNVPTRESREKILKALRVVDAYQELVTSDADYRTALESWRKEGIEELMDDAARYLAKELRLDDFRSINLYPSYARVVNEWFDRLINAGRHFAATCLSALDQASYFHRVNAMRNDHRRTFVLNLSKSDPMFKWAVACEVAFNRIPYMLPHLQRIMTRDTDTVKFIQSFTGTHCLPGASAEEYIRKNDMLVYDEFADPVMYAALETKRWALVTYETGSRSNHLLFRMQFDNNVTVSAIYSRDNRTLHTQTPMYSLRMIFRIWKVEPLYDYLLECVERLLKDAILNEAIVINMPPKTEPVITIEDVDQTDDLDQADDADVIPERSTEAGEELLDDPSAGQAPTNAYIKNVRYQDALNAFRRLEVDVYHSNHTMLSRNGVTVNLLSQHQKDGQIIRKSAQSACRALGIPWADFVRALR